MQDIDNLTTGILRAKELEKHRLYVGALRQVDGNSIDFLQMIADVQETGRIIKPVHGRFLTIPTPLAGKHKANEFDGLFMYHTKNTNRPTLARVDNGKVRIYFLLKTMVRIPARSFLASTMEAGTLKAASDMFASGVSQLLTGDIHDYRYILNSVGKYIARRVKTTMKTKNSPKNKTITKLNKGNDDPLIDTGTLLRSISWVVV